jgi:hypothetical protein
MSCAHCRQDPQPPHFGNARKCAFDDDGYFTPDNWNCATMAKLLEAAAPAPRADEAVQDTVVALYGNDESMHVVMCSEEDGGWIVVTRYKMRGRTSSAVWVGDFYPSRLVTQALVERAIAYREAMRGWRRRFG